MTDGCANAALEWWFIAGDESKVFRCFCLAHSEVERLSDLAAFGSAYIPGSDGGDPNHA